jgi:hypothetical protein
MPSGTLPTATFAPSVPVATSIYWMSLVLESTAQTRTLRLLSNDDKHNFAVKLFREHVSRVRVAEDTARSAQCHAEDHRSPGILQPALSLARSARR